MNANGRSAAWRFAGALTILLALCLAGCGRHTAVDSVKIGANLELTGDIQAVGKSSENAAKLFFEQLNAAGGIALEGGPAPAELVVRDNAASADQAAAVAQQLIMRDKVTALVGPNSSACAIAAAGIAENLKCVMLSPWSTSPHTTRDASSGAPRRHIFRACYTDSYQARALAAFALGKLGAKKAAVLYEKTSEEPSGQAELFRETFTAGGGEIVAFESYGQGDREFAKQAAAIREAGPDIVFLPAYFTDVPRIARQLRQGGIDATLLGSDAWHALDIIRTGGADLEGSYFTNHFSDHAERPEARKFVADYTAKFGQPPDDVAALTYDACGLIVEALEKAGKNDREALREALAQIREYKGVTGTFRFEPGSGDPLKSVAILRIKDGAFVHAADVAP